METSMNPNKKFSSPGTLPLVYIGYFYPRTQIKLANLIYGNSNPTKTCYRPIIKRRTQLQKQGVINSSLTPRNTQTTAEQYLNKNVLYTSKIEPLKTFIVEEIKKRETKSHKPQMYELDGDDLNFIEKFFDSTWFRSFFSDEWINLQTDDGLYHMGRDERGKLWVSNALRLLVDTAVLIFSISNTFERRYRGLLPSSSECRGFRGFEEFADSWYNKTLKSKLKKDVVTRFLRCAHGYPSNFIVKLTERSLEPPYYALCVPAKFYEIFSLAFWNSSYSLALDKYIR